jgi:hypothetical protein
MYTKIVIVLAGIALWLSVSPATVLKGNASVQSIYSRNKILFYVPSCKVDIHRLSLKNNEEKNAY